MVTRVKIPFSTGCWSRKTVNCDYLCYMLTIYPERCSVLDLCVYDAILIFQSCENGGS